MKHGLLAFASIAILLVLFLWRRKLITEGVTTTISYQGKPVKNITLDDLKSRLYSNEYINNGRLCSNQFGTTVCYGGDPIDILIMRGA